MRMSLELIVVAIIILVVSIVVLTIFGGGISQFGTATDARSNCLNQGKWSCETSGSMPAGWDTIHVYREGDDTTKWKTCGDLVGKSAEECCKSEIKHVTVNKIKTQQVMYKWNC